jgi:hypothetical protein
MVDKLFLLLFKLKIPFLGQFWGVLGENEPHGNFLEALETPKGTSLHETASFDVQIVKICRASFAGCDDKKRTE